MKLFLLSLTLSLTFFTTYSQDLTEKYNKYLERYEYFNDDGDLVGFKEYNNFLEQWEYTKVSSSQRTTKNKYENLEFYQPDYQLINKALRNKQRSYDNNKTYVLNSIEEMGALINQKYRGSKNKDKAVEFFMSYSGDLIDQLIPAGTTIDFSSSSTTNAILNTYIKALKKTFETVPVRKVVRTNVNSSKEKSNQYTNRGGEYFNSGKYSLAIIEFKKALIENPNNYSANYYLALSLLDKEKSIINEMNSLGLSKEDNDRYNELDKARKTLYREVLIYLEKAYELKKEGNEDVLKTIGNLYANLGNMEKFKEIQQRLKN